MNSSSPAPRPTGPGSAPRPVVPTARHSPRDHTQRLRCDRCAQTPANPLEQILMSAQWLIPGPDGPALARYCRACPPTGPITDLTCTRCGDGPLLTADLAAGPDGVLPDPARHWLTAAGWHLDGPVCPSCHAPHQP